MLVLWKRMVIADVFVVYMTGSCLPLEVSCFGLWFVIAHVTLWKRMVIVDILVVGFSSDVLLMEVVAHS